MSSLSVCVCMCVCVKCVCCVTEMSRVTEVCDNWGESVDLSPLSCDWIDGPQAETLHGHVIGHIQEEHPGKTSHTTSHSHVIGQVQEKYPGKNITHHIIITRYTININKKRNFISTKEHSDTIDSYCPPSDQWLLPQHLYKHKNSKTIQLRSSSESFSFDKLW